MLRGGTAPRDPLRAVPALSRSVRHARLQSRGVRQRGHSGLPVREALARARAAGLRRLVLDPNLGIFHPTFDAATKIAYQIQAIAALPAVAALGVPTLAYLARKKELSSRLLIAAQLAAAGVDYVRAHEPAPGAAGMGSAGARHRWLPVAGPKMPAGGRPRCVESQRLRWHQVAVSTDLYLALGSNIAPRRHLAQALRLLRARYPLLRVSSWFHTLPWGETRQPWFLNCAAHVVTREEPLQVLDFTQAVERLLGRRRVLPNGPRTVDIDLLLYGHHVHDDARLMLPHPGLRAP